MHAIKSTSGLAKSDAYRDLNEQLKGLLNGERNALANAANTCALLYAALPDLNWAGFYFLQENELVLGPFQGKVACVRIALGQGVCGSAAARREILVVRDVHEFPGHIACDSASNSEIVLPLLDTSRLWGVLDLDSPLVNRFDQEDSAGLQQVVDTFLQATDLGAFFGNRG